MTFSVLRETGLLFRSKRKGVHNQTMIQDAENGIVTLDKAYDPKLIKSETVRILTVAPEIEGIFDVVPELVKLNITVSIGHSQQISIKLMLASKQVPNVLPI